MIKSRVLKTGDGSHKYNKLAAKDAENPSDNNNNNNNNLLARDTEHFWGFGKFLSIFCLIHFNSCFLITGDKEMTEEDLKNVLILNREFD